MFKAERAVNCTYVMLDYCEENYENNVAKKKKVRTNRELN